MLFTSDKNKITTINTNGYIDLSLHSHFLPHSAWIRDKTKLILEWLSENDLTRKLFCIDWSKFTSNIRILTDDWLDSTSILLPSWIDGIISATKQKNEIILPVWDCWAIAAYHKSWEINGLFHAWYKWVAWNSLNDLWIIVSMLDNLKNLSNSNNLEDFNFYLSPMMWWNFELPRDYVTKIFNNLFHEYNLNENKYFLDHKEDKNKIYLNLKQIILDILKKNKVRTLKQVTCSKSITNNPTSPFPSYRLHTIAKSFEKKSEQFSQWIEPDKYTTQEIKLFLSKKLLQYLRFDYRLALKLKNYKKD